jgi:phosphatidylglycerophosphate synthase
MHRRPLAIRAKKWPSKLALFLNKLGFTANGISTLSVGFGLATLVCLLWQPYQNARLNFFLAALFIQARLICNLLDGMVAVEGGKKTPTGGLFNEVPDRFCDAFTLVGLGYASSNIWFSVELGYVATILAFFTAYIRVLGASLGTASYFNGPQAKQQRMAVCTVALLLTAASLWTVFLNIALWVVVIGSWVTCLNRLRLISVELNKTNEVQ